MPQDSSGEVVIIDDNGTEHHFPPGFDPKVASTKVQVGSMFQNQFGWHPDATQRSPQQSLQLPQTSDYSPADPTTVAGAGQGIAEGLGSSMVDFGGHIPGKRLLESQQSGDLSQTPFALGEAGGDVLQGASLLKGAGGALSKVKSLMDAKKAAATSQGVAEITNLSKLKNFNDAPPAIKAALEKVAQDEFGTNWMRVKASDKAEKLAELAARKYPSSVASNPFAPESSMTSRLMSVAGPAAKLGLMGVGAGAAVKYGPLLLKLLSGE